METILIRARVINKQGDLYTVKLIDGFASVETPIHASAVVQEPVKP